ncbi:MAG: UDP-N-acetylmuramoyl-L-alanine--D-glutamate ligase [Clostridia bacterium]|nr:UDP-N-acetylmuramoyl-L-alanine--D-glutamate ligase [Clostridia bacterium]
MFDHSKKYGILGLARSGIAAAFKIKSMGGNCFLSDMKPESEIPDAINLKADFECEFGQHSDKLLSCDEWIVSPGIPLTAPIIKLGREHKIKMISELEFGFQVKADDSKVIAVTGSNGKSTTASLIAHIISQSGKNCILAGNIGDAFCGFPIEQKGIDFIVLEVSSFQLDLIDSFRPDVALLLNITPDHLNRYESFNDYALSKFNIFRNQNQNDHAVLNMDDEIIRGHTDLVNSKTHYFSLDGFVNQIAELEAWTSDSKMVFKDNLECPFDELQIKGPHNQANAMSAVLACRCAIISDGEIISGIKSFTPLKHRLQYIASVNGVEFYNDSKATNTDSVKYALLSFEKPIRVIMGGSDKGEDFSVLTSLLKQKTKKVYLTGDTSDKMRTAWEGHIPVSVVDDFEACIKLAFHEANKGDVIVLSPACASYDKFRNFEHRGDAFINIVKKLVDDYEKE